MIEVFLEPTHRVLLVRAPRVLDVAVIERFAVMAKDLAERYGPIPMIVDFTGVAAVELPTGYIVALAHRPALIGHDDRRIFVSDTPEMFGLTRLYATHNQLAGIQEPRLARSVAEACRLLAIEAPRFEKLPD